MNASSPLFFFLVCLNAGVMIGCILLVLSESSSLPSFSFLFNQRVHGLITLLDSPPTKLRDTNIRGLWSVPTNNNKTYDKLLPIDTINTPPLVSDSLSGHQVKLPHIDQEAASGVSYLSDLVSSTAASLLSDQEAHEDPVAVPLESDTSGVRKSKLRKAHLRKALSPLKNDEKTAASWPLVKRTSVKPPTHLQHQSNLNQIKDSGFYSFGHIQIERNDSIRSSKDLGDSKSCIVTTRANLIVAVFDRNCAEISFDADIDLGTNQGAELARVGIEIDRNVKIVGNGHTLKANTAWLIIHVTSGNVQIDNLNIDGTGIKYGACIDVDSSDNSATLKVSNSTFANCAATGIYLHRGKHVTVEDSTFDCYSL